MAKKRTKKATARQSPAVKLRRWLSDDQLTELTERLSNLRGAIHDVMSGPWQAISEELQAMVDACNEIADVLGVELQEQSFPSDDE